MNSISSAQFTAMLVISDLFALLCHKGSLSVYMAAGLAVGTVIQSVIAVMFAKAADRGAFLPEKAKPLIAAGIILWSGVLLKGLWNASDTTFVPSESSGSVWGKLLITGLFSAVCLYVSLEGVKAAARSAVAASAFIIFFLLIDFASAVSTAGTGNIASSARYGTFAEGIMISFMKAGNLLTFIALLPLVRGSKVRGTLMYFSFRLVLCTAVIMTTLLVAGGIMDTADFPVIMAAQLSQPFSSQRIDALFLILFAVTGVFALSVQFIAVRITGKWRNTVVIGLSLLAMAVLTGCTSTGQVSDKHYLRCVGVDGNRLTMTFFSSDDIVTAEGEDIESARESAELSAGRPVVTGLTEMIILGDCDRKAVLSHMLREWKVSPSCMVVYSSDPEYTMKNTAPDLLEGRMKEAIKQEKARKCDIVTVLGDI